MSIQPFENRGEPLIFAENVPDETAQLIQQSFTRAADAKSPEVRHLLEELAYEVMKMVAVLPTTKGREAASELQMLTEAAVTGKATKKHWETVKADLTASAELGGMLDDKALDLLNKLAHLLD